MRISGIQKKAARVSLVFDTVAWVIAALGTLGVALSALGFLFALIGGKEDPVTYLIVSVVIAIYTAVMWASVSLATIVAGYISNKEEELDRVQNLHFTQ